MCSRCGGGRGFYKQLRALLRVSGVDLAVTRQPAGHESEEMTELYTTRLDSLMQQAVAAWWSASSA